MVGKFTNINHVMRKQEPLRVDMKKLFQLEIATKAAPKGEFLIVFFVCLIYIFPMSIRKQLYRWSFIYKFKNIVLYYSLQRTL